MKEAERSGLQLAKEWVDKCLEVESQAPRFTSVLLVRRREQPSAAGADLGFDDGSHLLSQVIAS